jgi:hypothetical protein
VSVDSDGGELEPLVYFEEASVYRDGVDEARISGNGRVVAFSSHANGLVPDDDNNVPDIFAHEIDTGVTERVSVPTGGGDGYRAQDRTCGTNGQCFWHIASQAPSISHDGRFVRSIRARYSSIRAIRTPGMAATTISSSMIESRPRRC